MNLEKSLKEYFYPISIASVILGLYASLIESSSDANNLTFNPLRGLSIAVHNHNFSFSSFGLFSLMFLCMFIAMIVALSKSYGSASSDVLGRKVVKRDNRQTHGNADFEGPDDLVEIARTSDLDDTDGTVYGKWENGKVLSSYETYNRPNENIMVFGATGVGKTRSFVKPYMFQCVKRRVSMVLTDLKGELYEDMAPYLVKMGYEVRMLNLKDQSKSNGWNCLKCINMDNLDDDSLLFASTFLMNAEGAEVGNVHFTAAKVLFKAIIKRVLLGNDFVDDDSRSDNEFNISALSTNPKDYMKGTILGKKNIKSIIDIISHPKGMKKVKGPNGEVKYEQETSIDFLNALFNMEVLKNVGAEAARKDYDIFLDSSKNLSGNILISLNSYLAPLHVDKVQEILSTDDIDLKNLEKKPCAYFCVSSKAQYRPITSVFFAFAHNTLETVANSRHSRRLKKEVHFVLDEFPSVGTLPDWADKMATIRSYGMVAVMISQDLPLMRKNYGESTASIISNCFTIISLGINEGEDTAKFLEDRMCSFTAMTTTERRERFDSLYYRFFGNSENYSMSEIEKKILTSAEFLKMNLKYNVVMFQAHDPVILEKVPYTDFAAYKDMPRLNPTDVPYKRRILSLPNINTLARLEIIQKVNDYCSWYLEEHGEQNDLTENIEAEDLNNDQYKVEFERFYVIKRKQRKLVADGKKLDFVDMFEEDDFMPNEKLNHCDLKYDEGFRDKNIDELESDLKPTIEQLINESKKMK